MTPAENPLSTRAFPHRATRRRIMGAALVASIAVIFLAGVATAMASKAKVGEFGQPAGSGKGQLKFPQGVAVNRTSAGGVSAGDVYVVDSANNRIEEFSDTGTFVRTWGIDVVASGPDDKGSSAFEVCLPADECKAGAESAAAGGLSAPVGVAVDEANGNVYVIDANENKFTSNSRVAVYSAQGAFEGAFGWSVDASDPKEELQFCTTATGCQKGTGGGGTGQISFPDRSLPAVGSGSPAHLYVPEGGNGVKGNFRIEEFAPALNGSNEVTGVEFVKSIGWDVVESGPDQSDEVQRVTVNATTGKFKLKYKTSTTGEFDYNVSPSAVQSALEALPAIVSDGLAVTVGGGPGDAGGSKPYVVTLRSSPRGNNVPQLVATGVGLSGGGASVGVETYNNGSEGLEACVAARGDACKVGSEGGHMGQFNEENPTSVAIDSSGAVYAVNQSPLGCAEDPLNAPCRVYKFAFPAVGEVAAAEFAPAYLTHTSGTPNAVNPTDVAVDPTDDHVLVAKKEGESGFKFLEFDSAGTLLEESPAEGVLPATSNPIAHGLAIGTEERFYFVNPLGMVDILGPPPPPTACCVTVSDVGTAAATFEGKVTLATGPEGEHFPTGYHFEYSKDGGTSWKPFPEEDAAIGDGSAGGTSSTCPAPEAAACEVKQEVTGLQPGTEYLARLVASNGSPGTSAPSLPFTTEPAAPSISETVAKQVGKTSAELAAMVSPNGEETTYRFEWGETAAYGNESPEVSIGSGGEALEVSLAVELEEATAYHFRVVATNPLSPPGGTPGPDREFTTLDSFGLPEGRKPEQVSPNDKRPVGLVGTLALHQLNYQAASDGESFLYTLQNGLPDSTAGGNVIYQGGRNAAGWPTDLWPGSQVTPPALVSTAGEGLVGAATGRVLYAPPDLSCELVESFEPLSAGTPAEDLELNANNLYRRNADGSYTLLTTTEPLELALDPIRPYKVDWASADCSHVLFNTGYRLKEEVPAGVRGLYEWEEGQEPPLRVAGVRPDGSIPPGALAGGLSNFNSLSPGGASAFFSAASDSGGDSGQNAVFVSERGAEPVDISQSQTGIPNGGDSNYQLASDDGSRVFFTARYGLADNGTSSGATSCSPSSGAGCDLYAYDVASKALTDLSADGNAADAGGAGVAGLLDASSDGSYAYFAARGQLLPGKGRTEARNLLGSGFYNVYLNHEGALSYVGLIEQGDATGAFSGADLAVDKGHWVADATPDGQHLVFVSTANMGYDSGGVAEAYLYSAGSGETACVSCRADGKPSEGNGDSEPLAALLQSELHRGFTEVESRPRTISDDGQRVFFKSADVLAPDAVAEGRNTYEWSHGQVYLLVPGNGVDDTSTEYLDASASGDDVFVVTKLKLVPQDFDNTTDVYDLRAPHVPGETVGPGPVVEPPPVCNPLVGASPPDGCRRPLTSQPGEGGPGASETFSGPGNPAGKKPKPRHPHRKRKGREHKHHQHKKGRAAR